MRKKRKAVKPKQPTITQLANKADRLWSLKIRSLGYCEWCSSKKFLQAAHVVTRNNRRLRWNLKNGMCLCAKCHFIWHGYPLDAAEWFRKYRPADHKYLINKRNRRAIDLGRGDYEQLVERLKK